jgi:alpha-L-rhamnosidase
MALSLQHLNVEGETSPIIAPVDPRFSWQIGGSGQNVHQAAYRIQVHGASEVDTGWVESDRMRGVKLGSRLKAGSAYGWNLAVRLGDGSELTADGGSMVTAPNLSAWVAPWVSGPLAGSPRTSVPLPLLRRSFHLDAVPKLSLLYATARGIYRVCINGQPIDNVYLAPGWTDYRKRLRVQAYDVSALLQPGENVIAVELGDGWYCGHVEWRGREMYGDRPAFTAQLVNLENPNAAIVESDGEWRVFYGPILQADLLMGEHRDARRVPTGWIQPGFDASAWLSVLTEPVTENLVPQDDELVRVTQTLPAKSITSRPAGKAPEFVIDFGQNLVGFLHARLKGEKGTCVRIRHAEVLTDDGGLYTANLRSAAQTDYFTLAGDPEGEMFEPSLTFHGFRYAAVHGVAELQLEDVQAHVIHTAYQEGGEFECNQSLVNQLIQNVRWGWRGNSVDVPTDCPQRDERLGWTGDAQVFIRTSTFLCDAQKFWEKYIVDLIDAQLPSGAVPCIAPNTDIVAGDGGPAWSDAMTIVPWNAYLQYGDPAILELAFPAVERYVEYLHGAAIEGIRSHPDSPHFSGFGDWLSINAETPNELIGTAFYAYSTRLAGRMAAVLGEGAKAETYAARADGVARGFRDRYVSPSGVLVAGTQTAHLLALQFDLLEPHQRAVAIDQIVRDVKRRNTRISAGFVGSSYMNPILTDGDQAAIAFALMEQTQWPSWLYAVTQGATTIWERWDGWTHDKGFQDAGMNSFNHYAYGAIAEWLWRYVAGIDTDPEQPGFRRAIMRPVIGGTFTHVRAAHDAPPGRFESEWKMENERVTWRVVVPPNATALLVPPMTVESGDVSGGEVGSGTYTLIGRRG